MTKVEGMDMLSRVGHAHPDSKGRVGPPPTCMLLVISVLRRLLALPKMAGRVHSKGRVHLTLH
jgi:hypothetical protein